MTGHDQSMYTAQSVLFVGDSHGNESWFTSTVLPTARELGVDAIFQVGDFGWWPDDMGMARVAMSSRELAGCDTLFIDGNHEHHEHLEASVEAARKATGQDELSADPVCLGGSLFYLPRGARIEIGAFSVVCVGGAASIDKAFRKTGVDWFAQEWINDVDIAAVEQGGSGDILVMHDAPGGFVIPGLPTDIPIAWVGELGNCEAHRARAREVFDIVQPSLLVHGHYHSGYATTLNEEWGDVSVVGLDCDATMAWGLFVRADGDELTVAGVGSTRVEP